MESLSRTYFLVSVRERRSPGTPNVTKKRRTTKGKASSPGVGPCRASGKIKGQKMKTITAPIVPEMIPIQVQRKFRQNLLMKAVSFGKVTGAYHGLKIEGDSNTSAGIPMAARF